jgi:hypothetical protein
LSALPEAGDFIIDPTPPIASEALEKVPVPWALDITLLGDGIFYSLSQLLFFFFS